MLRNLLFIVALFGLVEVILTGLPPLRGRRDTQELAPMNPNALKVVTIKSDQQNEPKAQLLARIRKQSVSVIKERIRRNPKPTFYAYLTCCVISN
ncbi:hypothetical protein Ddc_17477 [Ditylenchus destructor]|nr:hypothetical protein Ddc_17477 [Ditylenchus destructor]